MKLAHLSFSLLLVVLTNPGQDYCILSGVAKTLFFDKTGLTAPRLVYFVVFLSQQVAVQPPEPASAVC